MTSHTNSNSDFGPGDIVRLDCGGEARLYEVVDLSDSGELVFRMDAEGFDASRSDGEEGRDWEYVYVPRGEVG